MWYQPKPLPDALHWAPYGRPLPFVGGSMPPPFVGGSMPLHAAYWFNARGELTLPDGTRVRA